MAPTRRRTSSRRSGNSEPRESDRKLRSATGKQLPSEMQQDREAKEHPFLADWRRLDDEAAARFYGEGPTPDGSGPGSFGVGVSEHEAGWAERIPDRKQLADFYGSARVDALYVATFGYREPDELSRRERQLWRAAQHFLGLASAAVRSLDRREFDDHADALKTALGRVKPAPKRGRPRSPLTFSKSATAREKLALMSDFDEVVKRVGHVSDSETEHRLRELRRARRIDDSWIARYRAARTAFRRERPRRSERVLPTPTEIAFRMKALEWQARKNLRSPPSDRTLEGWLSLARAETRTVGRPQRNPAE